MPPTPDQIRMIADIQQRASLTLAQNLMPFWAENAWDEQYGGFLTRLDRRGRRLEDHEKILVMQARMIAALSMAHSHGLNNRGYLDLAARGFRFLVDHFWDRENGGFHFSVNRNGSPRLTRKNTDFHGYALIGLAAYYQASGDPAALVWANRVFDILAAKAADGDWGYIEDFDGGDWDVQNADQMDLTGQRGIKTIDTHTNIMEGFTYLARVSQRPEHLNSLRAIVELIVRRGIHPEYGCSITAFDRDWRPITDARGAMATSYGLNVEIAWLLLQAVEVLQEDRERYRLPILGLIDHALEFGFDHESGGLAANGPLSGPITEAVDLPKHYLWKPWWAQAEMLNALIDAYEWTTKDRYLDAFIKLFDWVWRYQIDHECGDWYQDVTWDTGKPITTEKGGEWKTAFHAGRALIRVSEGLERILATA